MNKFGRVSAPSATAFVLGLLFGIWFIGFRNLMPWETAWLSPSPARLDHAVSQLNWEFLRNEPILQIPLGRLESSGLGWNSVYIPFAAGSLFGLGFRLISTWLPTVFQFMGLWLVFSFGMMGLCSLKIAQVVTKSKSHAISGAVLVFFAPVVTYRIGVLGHFELGAHWLILTALYLYLKHTDKLVYWLILIIVCLIVNVYLFAMTVVIFLAAQFKEILVKRPPKFVLRDVIGLFLVIGGLFYSFGFLEFRNNAVGLGFFRSNLLAYVYPRFNLGGVYQGSYSEIISYLGVFNNREFFAYEREGFGYLGLGAICGVVVGGISVIWLLSRSRVVISRTVIPLGLVAVAMFLNALSNRIAFGRRELVYLPLPQTLIDLRQIFRTAERFVWPLYYLLLIFAIWSIVTCFKSRKVASIILICMSVLQVLDTSGGILKSRNAINASSESGNLESSEWALILEGINKIALVPTFDFISDTQSIEIDAWRSNYKFFPLLKLAARFDLSTNFAVTGRPVTSIVERENLELRKRLDSGNLEQGILYVFPLEAEWSKLRNSSKKGLMFSKLDGYYLAWSS